MIICFLLKLISAIPACFSGEFQNATIGVSLKRWSKLIRRSTVTLMAVVVLSASFLLSEGVALAQPKHLRPPTVDPTYGLPLPQRNRALTLSRGVDPYWIWASRLADHQTLYLRGSLKLASVPHRVAWRILANARCAAFINGKKVVAFAPGGPAHQVNVAADLKPGWNVLAVRATNTTGVPGIVLWMWMHSDKKIPGIFSGKWRVTGGVLSKGWSQKKFDDSTWSRTVMETGYGGGLWNDSLPPWPVQHVSFMGHLYLQPRTVTVLHGRKAFRHLSLLAKAGAMKPGVDLVVRPAAVQHPPELLLDFGREVTGRIQVRGEVGQLGRGVLRVGTGESRGEALHRPWGGIHTLNLTGEKGMRATSTGYKQATPVSAFRYATITFQGDAPIRMNRLRLDFKYYPVMYRGAFDCSDPLLTRIWYTGAYTAHLCMRKKYVVESPKRGRSPSMGSLRISGQTISNVFGGRFLLERTLRYLRRQAQGAQPAAHLPRNDINGIPGYSAAWICGLADFYRHSGALDYIRSQHQLLLSLLRYLQLQFNKKNIFVNSQHHWTFVDWAPHLSSDTPQAYAATDLYICRAVQDAVFLLEAMGDQRHAAQYESWHKALVAAAEKYLASAKTHTFTSLRQVNALAIDAGVADASERQAIARRILGPACASWKQIATPYGNNYVLFALGDLGATRQGLNFVRHYWGGMIRQGATTFWQAYDPSWPKKHFHRYLRADHGRGYFVNLCSGGSCGATNWLTEYILGVRPLTGGFATTSIVPHLGDLHWVRGRVPTPHGTIALRVQASAKGETLRLTLPAEVRASIGVKGKSVRVNGQPVPIVRRGAVRSYVRLTGPGRYVLQGR